MTKPQSQADEPTLFPREWVIGRAAAELVREDEGVLLDQPWILAHGASPGGAVRPAGPPSAQVPELARPGAVSAPPAAAAPGPDTRGPEPAGRFFAPAEPGTSRRAPRPTSAEIEALKLGQARLERRFEAARMRPRPRYAVVSSAEADHEPVMMAEAPRQGRPGRSFPWRRLAILLVLSALASGLYQYWAVLLQL